MSSEINFNHIPTVIVQEIFSHIDPMQLGKVCCVCKDWERLANSTPLPPGYDLKKHFPSLEVIDEKYWKDVVDVKAHFLLFKGITPPQRRLLLTIKKSFEAKIEKDAGFTLLTIPQNLTMDTMEKIGSSSTQKNPIGFKTSYIFPIIEIEPEYEMTQKAYQILISNDVLEISKGAWIGYQVSLLKQLDDSRMPHLLELTTLVFLTYMKSKKKLYQDTCSRCLEKAQNNEVILKNSITEGPSLFNPSLDDPKYGVAVVKKLA
jgi:hypothetical protein